MGRRMRQVIANTRAAKERIRALPKDVAYAYAVLTFAAGETLALVPRGSVDFFLPSNVLISNVRGPSEPLYLNGARLEALCPVSTLISGMGLNITFMSYAGRVVIGFTANASALPEAGRLALYTREAFACARAAAAEVPVVGSVGFDDRVQPEVHTRLTVHAGIEMPAPKSEDLEYVGFWPRVGAALIDTLLILVVTVPLVTAIYGKQYWLSDSWLKGPADFLINWVLPAGAVLLFWIYRQATPGKIAIGARIVDAERAKSRARGNSSGVTWPTTFRSFHSWRASSGSPSIRASRDGTTSWPARSSCGRSIAGPYR